MSEREGGGRIVRFFGKRRRRGGRKIMQKKGGKVGIRGKRKDGVNKSGDKFHKSAN